MQNPPGQEGLVDTHGTAPMRTNLTQNIQQYPSQHGMSNPGLGHSPTSGFTFPAAGVRQAVAYPPTVAWQQQQAFPSYVGQQAAPMSLNLPPLSHATGIVQVPAVIGMYAPVIAPPPPTVTTGHTYTPPSPDVDADQETEDWHGTGARRGRAQRASDQRGSEPPGGLSDDIDLEDEAMERLYAYIRDLGGQLEDGWTAGSKMRLSGTSSGQVDVYYFSPAGKRYRSRQEVAKALGLMGGAPATRTTAIDTEVNKGPKCAARMAILAMSKQLGAKEAHATDTLPPLITWNGALPGELSGGITLHSIGTFAGVTSANHYSSNTLYPAGLTTSRKMALLLELPEQVYAAAVQGNPLHNLPSADKNGMDVQAGRQVTAQVTLVSQIVASAAGPLFRVSGLIPGCHGHIPIAEGPNPEVVWQTVWEHQRKGLLHVRSIAAAAAAVMIANIGESALPPTPSAAALQHPSPHHGEAGMLPASPHMSDIQAAMTRGTDGMSLRSGAMPMVAPPPPGASGQPRATAEQNMGASDDGEQSWHGGTDSTDPMNAGPALLERITHAAAAHAESLSELEVRIAARDAVQELPPVQALLACVEPFECALWGRMEYGLCDVDVLQALEHVPEVEKCVGYVPLAERPGGIAAEARAIGKEAGRQARETARTAARAHAEVTKAVGRAVAAALKSRKRAAGAAATPLPGAKRARAGAVEGGAWTIELGPTGEPRPWLGDPRDHPDGLLAGYLAAGKGYTESTRNREAIARVLDRVVAKLEEKERKTKDKEEGRAPRRRAKAGHEHEGSAPATPSHELAADDETAWQHKAARPQQSAPTYPPTPPQPLAHVLAQGLLNSVMNSNLKASLDNNTAHALQQYVHSSAQQLTPQDWSNLMQVWDFTARFHPLLGLTEPLTLADTLALVLPCPGPDLLLSEAVQKLAGTASSHLAHIGMCLTRWVVDDVYCAVANQLGDMPNLKKRELMAGLPPVDYDTWQEVARRLLLGIAGATVMAAREEALKANGHPASVMTTSKPGEAGTTGKAGEGTTKAPGAGFVLPYPLLALDPHHWLQLLLGGLPSEQPADQLLTARNAAEGPQGLGAGSLPARVKMEVDVKQDQNKLLLPSALRPILLPPYTMRSVADALTTEQEAVALASAERLMQQHRLNQHGPASQATSPTATHAAAGLPTGDKQFHDVAAAGLPASAADAEGGKAKGKFKIKIKGPGAPGGATHGGEEAGSKPGSRPASDGGVEGQDTPQGHVPDECYEDLSPTKRAAREMADISAGRYLLLELCGVKAKKGGTGVLMGVCVNELAALLRQARGVDFKGVAARLDARVYQATGHPTTAMISDIQTCLTMWRAAADKVSHKAADKAAQMLPPGFDSGGNHLGSECQKRLAALQSSFRQQARQKAAGAPSGTHRNPECHMHATHSDTSGVVKSEQPQGITGPGVTEKPSEQNGDVGTQPSPDANAIADTARPFCPQTGTCRVCWRNNMFTPPPITAAAGKSGSSATSKAAGGATTVKADPSSNLAQQASQAAAIDPQHSLIQCSCCGDEYHPFCVSPQDVLTFPESDNGWLCPACHPAALLSSPQFQVPEPPPAVEDQDESEISDFSFLKLDSATATHVRTLLHLVDLLAAHDILMPGSVQPSSDNTLVTPQSIKQELALHGDVGVHPGNRSWGISERVMLLATLVEAASEGTIVRSELDRQAEARDKARKELAALKSKAKKGPSEAAAPAPQPGDAAAGEPAAPPAQGITPEETKQLAVLSNLEQTITLRGGEEAISRRACLGEDRYGNRYWLLGLSPSADPKAGDDGTPAPYHEQACCVIVEVVTPLPGMTAAMLQLPYAGEPPQGGWGGWAAALQIHPGAKSLLPPKGRRKVWESDPSQDQLSTAWAVYTDAASLSTLISHLWMRDSCEATLRTNLTRARNNLLQAAQSAAAAGIHPQYRGAPPVMPCMLQCSIFNDMQDEDDLPVPQSLWCHSQLIKSLKQHLSETGKTGSEVVNLLCHVHDVVQATAIREQLTKMFEQQVAVGMRQDGFWGSQLRQTQWQAFLAGCEPTTSHISAAVTLLEGMLSDAAFKPHARFIARPAQHPHSATTWASVRYRLQSLEAAVQVPVVPDVGYANAYSTYSTSSKAKGSSATPPPAAAVKPNQRASGRDRKPSARAADSVEPEAEGVVGAGGRGSRAAKRGQQATPPLASGTPVGSSRSRGRKAAAETGTTGSVPGSPWVGGSPAMPSWDDMVTTTMPNNDSISVSMGHIPMQPPLGYGLPQPPLPAAPDEQMTQEQEGWGAESDEVTVSDEPARDADAADSDWVPEDEEPKSAKKKGRQPAGMQDMAPPPPPPGFGISTAAPHMSGGWGTPMPLPPAPGFAIPPMPPMPVSIPPAASGSKGRKPRSKTGVAPAPPPPLPMTSPTSYLASNYMSSFAPAPPPPGGYYAPAPPPPPPSWSQAPQAAPRSSRRQRNVNPRYGGDYEVGDELEDE